MMHKQVNGSKYCRKSFIKNIWNKRALKIISVPTIRLPIILN